MPTSTEQMKKNRAEMVANAKYVAAMLANEAVANPFAAGARNALLHYTDLCTNRSSVATFDAQITAAETSWSEEYRDSYFRTLQALSYCI